MLHLIGNKIIKVIFRFNYAGVGINLINPYNKDKFYLSSETIKQILQKRINRYSKNSGFYFPNRSLFNNIGNKSFLLAGLTLQIVIEY